VVAPERGKYAKGADHISAHRASYHDEKHFSLSLGQAQGLNNDVLRYRRRAATASAKTPICSGERASRFCECAGAGKKRGLAEFRVCSVSA